MLRTRFLFTTFLLLAGCGGTTAQRSTGALRGDATDAAPGSDPIDPGPATDGGPSRGVGGGSGSSGRPARPTSAVEAGTGVAEHVPKAAVDSQGLPRATCRTGALYAPLEHGTDSSSIPVELLLPAADRPEWARTTNLEELLRLTPPLSQTYVRGPPSSTCAQGPIEIGLDGALASASGEAGLSIWTEKAAPDTSCGAVGNASCHPHGAAGVSWDCGALPEGEGGPIVSGVYALVGYVRYEGTSFPALGAYVVQTLYLTDQSAFVVSYDDNDFGYAGTARYVVTGKRLMFTETCGSQPVMYRPFPAQPTYTAAGRVLELFDEARNVRSTFVRMD
jgi:hypothetical protein